MQHNETDFDVSPQQQRALSALLSGTTVIDAAKRARVSRTTVHRWLREPDFRGALYEQFRELQEAARYRILAMVDSATTTLQSAIANGDSRAALAVLKGIGLLSDSLLQKVADADGETNLMEPLTVKQARQNLIDLLQKMRARKAAALAAANQSAGDQVAHVEDNGHSR